MPVNHEFVGVILVDVPRMNSDEARASDTMTAAVDEVPEAANFVDVAPDSEVFTDSDNDLGAETDGIAVGGRTQRRAAANARRVSIAYGQFFFVFQCVYSCCKFFFLYFWYPPAGDKFVD